ncbi:dethiobiotin synthase [Niveibacterium sp. SC-1]|uniref:dethiobiotin synthase n=1 Tax=Niveibacterium sp. SC-1 TaxID=3135646 RepID=UPI00311F858C
MQHYFVTGTDTGVGKTFTTCALLHHARQRGLVAVGYKPVAAGAEPHGEDLANEDALALQAAGSSGFALSEINPFCLRAAVAPHIAAAEEGVSLDIGTMHHGYQRLAARADLVLVEGAGGFCVPLDDTHDTADLARALALPVLMVVGMRLGCINHALLTAEAIAARGLKLAGWYANSPQADMPRLAENLQALRQRLPAPLLGVVPHLSQGPAAATTQVQLPGGL